MRVGQEGFARHDARVVEQQGHLSHLQSRLLGGIVDSLLVRHVHHQHHTLATDAFQLGQGLLRPGPVHVPDGDPHPELDQLQRQLPPDAVTTPGDHGHLPPEVLLPPRPDLTHQLLGVTVGNLENENHEVHQHSQWFHSEIL